MMHLPLLSLQIWVPILGAIPVLFFLQPKQAHYARWVALGVALLVLLLSTLMWFGFDRTTPDMQFQELAHWIPTLRINYHLGVDGIAMPMIALTSFTTLIVVLASWTMVQEKVAEYLAAFLIMQGAVIGVFASMDSMLFYFFWEAMLIPMYLSIGIWGGANRSFAAIKFFLYTFFGSAMLLVVILYLRLHSGSFDISSFYTLPISMTVQKLLFFAFLLAFAVKIPMWPVHTWLPLAHTEAPTGGSVILAALMLKLGAYGFFRFNLPIVPDACHLFEWLMIGLSLVAIVYVGLVAIVQTDMKKLIAYSSIAHMGFVTLGGFMVFVIIEHTTEIRDAYMSLEGAMVQMISHAFGSGAMFLAFGVLYRQMHTRLIKDFGGVASVMPVFSAFFLVFVMSNIALPGTSGFVGEFMILLSTFKANFWVALLAASTLIIGASYSLWMFKRVFYGEVASDVVENLEDVQGVELLTFVLLAAAIFWVGLYPAALVNVFHASIGHLLQLSMTSKLA